MVIRTQKGEDIINDMVEKGLIEVKPSDEDPAAVELMDKLAKVSRKRWPESAASSVRRHIPVR